MDPAVERDAKQFAGAPLERRARDVRVSPFDQHALVVDGPGRRDRRGGRVAGKIQSWKRVIVRIRCSRQRRLLEVNGVEPSVASVVWIELDADEATRQAGFRRELVEKPGGRSAAREAQIEDW